MEPAVIHEGSQKKWKVVYDRGGSVNILEEDLVGEALKPYRKNVVIASKFGVHHSPQGLITDSHPKTIRRADSVFPVAAIESEYNMMWRETEEEILPTLSEMNIGLVPYRPLARGFLTDAAEGMFLEGAKNTRFDEKNLPANMVLKNKLMEIAAEKNITAAQFALAWLLAQKSFIVPIPGTSKMKSVEENVRAAEVTFTEEEMKEINEALNQITIVGRDMIRKVKTGKVCENSKCIKPRIL